MRRKLKNTRNYQVIAWNRNFDKNECRFRKTANENMDQGAGEGGGREKRAFYQ